MGHLSIFQVENFMNKLYMKDYQTPQEAMSLMKAKASECRMRRLAQQRKTKKACRAQLRRTCGSVENVSQAIMKCFKPFISSAQQISLTAESAKYSDTILLQICQLMRIPVPPRDSCCLVQQILCKIADKLAWWMVSFLENSKFRDIDSSAYDKSECAKEFKKSCFSIEDYYPHENPADTSDDEDEAFEPAEKCKPDEPVVVDAEKKMSFLRKSQIVLNPDDCKDIFSKIADYQKTKAEKEIKIAEKVAIKKEKAKKAKQEKALKAKKGKHGKKSSLKSKKGKGKKSVRIGGVIGRGNGSDDEFDCYGNVNKKPQWQIEWIEKSDLP
jgi:hypothetical protein